jgi:hypothetical protein
MPSTPASIATDLTMPVMPPLLTSHNYIYATPPSSGLALSLEFPVTIMWPPGFALAQNKLTTTVLHKAMPIALDGHNCGYMIGHLTIPFAPPNTLLPLQILFSSRKMSFSSSKVKANSAQVANTLVVFLPMLCCGNQVSWPTGTAITNIGNNLMIGLSVADIMAGFISIGLTMLTDWITRTKPKKPTELKVPGLRSYLEKIFIPTTKDGLKNLAIKTAMGVAAGLVRLAITKEGSVSVKVGSDYANVGASYSRSADGQWSISPSAQVGAPLNPMGAVGAVQGKYQYTSNPDGSSTSAWSGSTSEAQPALLGGGAARQSASTSTTTDAHGKETSKTTTGNQVVATEPGFGYASNSQSTTTSKPGSQPATKSSGYSGGRAMSDTWGKPL